MTNLRFRRSENYISINCIFFLESSDSIYSNAAKYMALNINEINVHRPKILNLSHVRSFKSRLTFLKYPLGY